LIPERVVHAKEPELSVPLLLSRYNRLYKAKIFSEDRETERMYADLKVGGEKGRAEVIYGDPRDLHLRFIPKTVTGIGWKQYTGSFIKDPKKFSHFYYTRK